MYQNVELRKLPADALCKVVSILEKDEGWKKVMSVIPKDLQSENFEPKYNYTQIGMIEEHAKVTSQKCTDILIDEWGTSGRFRPTLSTLKNILIKAQIFSAADEIAIMLNGSVPVRPNYSTAEPILTKKINESAELRLQDKNTTVKSSKSQKYKGSTRQKKFISDNKMCSNEMLPDQVKPASDFIDSTKEQQTQESVNIKHSSYMLESKDSESFKLNNQFYPKPYYQTSFPNINISSGIESAVLEDTDLANFADGKSVLLKSNDNPKYKGSTRQKKFINDNKICSNEMLPGQVKPASDFIDSTKEQQTQESMSIKQSSYMLRKSNSAGNLQSTTSTNESKDSESFQLNNSNIYQYYPKPLYYQTSLPNINISSGIESVVLPDTDLANFADVKSTAVKSNNNQKYKGSTRQKKFRSDNKTCSSEMLTNINIPTGIESAVLKNTSLAHFDYGDLDNITGNFSKFLINDPNHGPKGKIGSGGFGDVFVGKDSTYGMVAVKKVHSHLAIHRKPNIIMSLFNTEVKYLSQFRHNNIVPILGFSMNGPFPCIVCEYIDGGSVQQNIKAKILNGLQRINIMVGTAEGLKYLHTSDQQCKEGSSILNAVGVSDSQNSIKHFVHGDIKTANILLTRNCVPKLCDFGLAKQYDSTFVTTCPMGTSAYMAPEGMHGTVTQKIDIYSFGIVILEILTGLKPIVKNDGENINIKHYVEEKVVNNDITPLLDPVVKIWVKADEFHKLAKMCLKHNRKLRPTINEVCNILNRILSE